MSGGDRRPDHAAVPAKPNEELVLIQGSIEQHTEAKASADLGGFLFKIYDHGAETLHVIHDPQ